ncbi:MAG TPA: hypothetical protein VM146_16650 [Steroidobacteraceae bacterium]|nr:hypothetical protein [Steroidobacteraceae bacterium]
MRVVVVIEAEQFTDMLADDQRKTIESRTAKALVAELAKPFPIIDWRAEPGIEPAATLTAAIVERRLANADPNADPEINLVWRAKSKDGPVGMPNIGVTTLYSSGIVDRPVDDPHGIFTEKLRSTVVSWANSENIQDALKQQFLNHVLIADKVVAAGSQFVVVPLPYRDAKMRKDTVLRVQYNDGAPHGLADKEFTLTGAVLRDSDPLPGSTQTHVAICALGGAPVPTQDNWAKCVAPLSANPRTVKVFADPYNYEAHPEVDDAGVIVTE